MRRISDLTDTGGRCLPRHGLTRRLSGLKRALPVALVATVLRAVCLAAAAPLCQCRAC